MDQPTRRPLRRSAAFVAAFLLAALGTAALAVATTPAPAGAHGVGGIQPTNYQTRLTSVRPHVSGLTVRSVDLGGRLEVTNHTGHEILVLGYDGEPYLRIGPRGVFENTRSPATYVNRTLTGSTPVPRRASSDAPPVWRRTGDGPTARWHDHRAHWASALDAPGVRRDRDREQIVQRFRVELRDRGRPVVVRGIVRWVPGPSPWPWIVAAVVLAAAVILVARGRAARPAVSVALLAVAVVESAHVVAAWGATTESTGTRLGASVYELGAIAVAIVALVWVRRRGVDAAAPLVLVAGLFAALAGGLADVSSLTHSQLPTTLPDAAARAIVATALGLGLGLAVTGALLLRRTQTRRRRPARRLGQPPDRAPWPATQS
jgi:hypothetical protein